MCYMVTVSTTSEVDLSVFNTRLVQFSRDNTGVPEANFLHYPHKWFLGSKDGCSCGFRHLNQKALELGFSEPVDWWEENQEDIDATAQVVEIFLKILGDGHKLDCIDAWVDDNHEPKIQGNLVVDLNNIKPNCFRFFESHYFELIART